MTEIVSQCPLCGSKDSTLFDQRSFRNQPVTNVICRACGLVFQSPRMTDDESVDFYESEYRMLYQGQEGPNPKELSVQAERAQAALSFVHRYIQSAAQILDIGCSTGALLKAFRAYFHADAYGIEPGNLYRQYSKSLGLEVFPSLEDLLDTGSPHFNLISMMHVLEHLSHPVEYLAELRTRLLEPNGWLLVEVPNLYAHDCFEIAHLASYSPHTLEQVLRKAGFTVVQSRVHGSPRSQLIPLYLTLLAQPGTEANYIVAPDRLVRLKRQAGFFRRRCAERLLPQRAWLPVIENKGQ